MIRRCVVFVLAFATVLAGQDRATAVLAQRRADAVEYTRRAKAIPPGKAEQHLALARWCKARHLYSEMRRSLAAVVAVAPDHRAARKMLGQQKVGDRWLSRRDANLARGLVLHRGVWRTAQEVQKFEREQARRKHLARIKRRVRTLGRKLAHPSKKASREACNALIALGRTEKIRRLGYEAEKLWFEYRKYWRAYARDRAMGVFEIRAQKVDLLGIDNFTTSLGPGNPVTIQLPRKRSIRIGTTVSVPLGIR